MALVIRARQTFNLGHRVIQPGEALDFSNPFDVEFVRQRLRWSAFAVSHGPDTAADLDHDQALANAVARAEAAEARLADIAQTPVSACGDAVRIDLAAILADRDPAELTALGLTDKQAERLLASAKAAAPAAPPPVA